MFAAFINIIIRSGIVVVFKRRCLGFAVKIFSYSVLKESIALNFALYFAKINILNENVSESAFSSNLPVNFKVYKTRDKM